jgi:hypothetical protein
MDIRRSTLLAALASLTTGPLSYTRDYPYTLMATAWRSTGLRTGDLQEVLRYCVGNGFMELHGDEIEARYRLTDTGSRAIADSRWFPWTRWRDSRVLERLRLRARAPSADGTHTRRGNDFDPAATVIYRAQA